MIAVDNLNYAALLSGAARHFALPKASLLGFVIPDMSDQIRFMRDLECMDVQCLAERLGDLLCTPLTARGRDLTDDQTGKRVFDLVHLAISRLSRRERPRPLFRSLTENIATSVIHTIPLGRIIAEDSPLAKPIAEAEMSTLPDLIALPPEQAHEFVLGGLHTSEFDDAVDKAEGFAEDTAVVVAKVVNKARRAELKSPRDWDDLDVRKKVTDKLIVALNEKCVPIRADVLRRMFRVPVEGEEHG